MICFLTNVDQDQELLDDLIHVLFASMHIDNNTTTHIDQNTNYPKWNAIEEFLTIVERARSHARMVHLPEF